jgi:hypothetical protein
MISINFNVRKHGARYVHLAAHDDMSAVQTDASDFCAYCAVDALHSEDLHRASIRAVIRNIPREPGHLGYGKKGSVKVKPISSDD